MKQLISSPAGYVDIPHAETFKNNPQDIFSNTYMTFTKEDA